CSSLQFRVINKSVVHQMRSLLLLTAFAAVAIQASPDEDRCRDRSCYPITGNLLIGRKHRLSASSTCGVHDRERFCIVSHLEEQTKCFYCDSRHEWRPYRDPYRLSHKIENVVSDSYETKNQAWWQSANGVQNVTVQLNLEAEFQFTHLIMTFKSFRPAAMIIERSSDFGKTWQVYRYFAYDCANSFPGVPEGPPSKHTDVICTRSYSDVAPSTGGEIVYKAISPHIATDDPYSDEISSLLRVTNIRFNFTKLHTLGDDLLDYRKEITEKYYYAIYEIVVRGSCSCYGHASSCIPIDDQAAQFGGEDIVHGRCECTHNTEGLNCEKCLPFFNDHPWRPAVANNTHECKRCECNSHASTCHFDQAVFDASGFVSGGVCDDCQHNTQGKNCEQCKPYFYKDPRRAIYDPYVCLPCDCDKAGSKNEGICEGEQDEERGLVAGKCYCKMNVDSHRCDRCKNGYWNLTAENPDGCVACTCHLQGTWNNEGCNKHTGECTCKRFVTGENCDQCIPEHYGLSDEPDGCKACDCDVGGSLNNQCDVKTGQCQCRDKFGGRRCDKPEADHYCADIDHYKYEAEQANFTHGNVEVRERPKDPRGLSWTGEGFVKVNERSSITFKVGDIQTSNDYNIVLRYDPIRDQIGWENLEVTLIRPSDPSPDSSCANKDPSSDLLVARLHPGARYYEVRPSICLEAGVEYEIKLDFGDKRTNAPDRSASLLLDSIVLAPPTEKLDVFANLEDQRAQQHKMEYDRYQCRHQALSLTPKADLSDTCKTYTCTIAAAFIQKGLECGCDPTGSVSGICAPEGGQCECKANVVGRKCDKCGVGTYGFGPTGCSECACDSVGSLNNQCDKSSGQCVCREKGIYGRQCNQCQPGFWGFPNCAVCQCNDHATICDQQSGSCIDCHDLTTGEHCDRCKDGYYGDPRLGVGLPCKPCPCPGGPGSGFQHADTCYLQPATSEVVCQCSAGYTGDRCGECAMNYWGEPNDVGGTCERCDCNGNIDMSVPGSCDAKTGDCLLCLHNSEGAQCENCVEGFWGDAKNRQCQRCICNTLGTNTSSGACDRVSGQCPCFPNVIGTQCDQCALNHYNIASGQGCAECACDPTGVEMDHEGKPDLQCNHFDGQCKCKRGRGGRTCSECEDYFWGDPTTPDGCKMCECDRTGSMSLQCHRNNGTCVCQEGSGGPLCNECARGFTGQWPHCKPCGECFHQWDAIVQALKSQVETLILTANNIEDTGVASAFDADFEKMEKELDSTRQKLQDANVDKENIEKLQNEIQSLKDEVAKAQKKLESISGDVAETTQDIEFAEKDVKELEMKSEKLKKNADELNEKTNKIKESDVQGAYNMTKEAAAKSLEAQRKTDAVVGILAETEKEANEVKELVDRNRGDFDKQYAENEAALAECENNLVALEVYLPDLNGDVCGAKSAPCDSLCGGPGSCGKCGGQSCLEGAVSRAEQAKNFALEADLKLNEKQAEAEEVLSLVREVLSSTSTAQREAEEALTYGEEAARGTNASRQSTEEILHQITELITGNRSTPEDIRAAAESVLAMKISHTPEEIEELNKKIREKLGSVQNTDKILAETRGNLSVAANLEERAMRSAESAVAIKNTTDTVRDALKMAGEAQTKASDAIKEAEEEMKAAREDLKTAKEATDEADGKTKETNETLSTLEVDMKKVKVQYLQILDDAKSAYDMVDRSQEASSEAEAGNKQLARDMETAANLLNEKSSGKEKAQERAEKIRARAADLLYKLQKYDEEYRALAKFDASEAMEDYSNLLDDYDKRARQLTEAIEKRSDYYQNCEA
ncbi:lam-1, partial [Pristionchus pacificus]